MDNNSLILWQKSLDALAARLRQQVPESQFGGVWSWFEQLRPTDLRGSRLVVGVPSERFRELFAEKYMPHFLPHLRTYMGEDTMVDFVVVEEPTGPATHVGGSLDRQAAEPEKPAPLDPQLNRDYTFKTFVRGASNKAALNVAKAIAKRPDQSTFNPLFLYGPSGVGKTHLVTAIGHGVRELYPDKRVLFVSANLFKTQYMDAARNGTTNDFMHFYQSIDVLIVDDIQELSTEKTQRTFFHIFNHLQLNGRQIVITCDRPPVLFEGIEERMLTRFKWGMVMEMERPDVALRHDIVSAKVRRDGLKFPKEVIAYIAENVTSNVRDLQGVVNSIMAYSIVDDCEVDLALTQRVVARVVNLTQREISLEDILKALCRCYKMKVRDVVGKSRKADIVSVRHLAMYLTQKYTQMSQSQIGQELGRRDHTTVLHGIRQVEQRLATDREYRQQVEAIEVNLKKK